MQRDESVDFLKGLAIIAVIGLHIIPFFVNSENVFSVTSQRLLTVMNYLRFAVPFFVALSGFSLARKYVKSPLTIREFLKSRVGKIIPLYLFWLGTIYLIVHLVPGWEGFSNSFSGWQIVFLGRGEYHLYFVPMIISLYLLFPILFWLTRKLGLLFVLTALVAQVWFYWYLGNVVIHDPTVKSLQTDQQQYVFFMSWIFYFVFGIYLGLNGLYRNLIVGVISLPLLAVGVRWTVSETKELLLFGYNIIFASGFTRLSVMALSTFGLMVGLVFSPSLLKATGRFLAPIIFMGRNSFIIFLSHTIVLRVLWAGFFDGVSVTQLIFPSLIWLLGIGLTLKGKQFLVVVQSRVVNGVR